MKNLFYKILSLFTLSTSIITMRWAGKRAGKQRVGEQAAGGQTGSGMYVRAAYVLPVHLMWNEKRAGVASQSEGAAMVSGVTSACRRAGEWVGGGVA